MSELKEEAKRVDAKKKKQLKKRAQAKRKKAAAKPTTTEQSPHNALVTPVAVVAHKSAEELESLRKGLLERLRAKRQMARNTRTGTSEEDVKTQQLNVIKAFIDKATDDDVRNQIAYVQQQHGTKHAELFRQAYAEKWGHELR